jgi:hypothetical protein
MSRLVRVAIAALFAALGIAVLWGSAAAAPTHTQATDGTIIVEN